MYACGATKSGSGGVLRLLFKPLEVADVEVDGVNRESSTGACGEENLSPGKTGDVTVATGVPPAGPAAQRGDKVLCSPHDTHRGTGFGDRIRFSHTLRRLTERDHFPRCE